MIVNAHDSFTEALIADLGLVSFVVFRRIFELLAGLIDEMLAVGISLQIHLALLQQRRLEFRSEVGPDQNQAQGIP